MKFDLSQVNRKAWAIKRTGKTWSEAMKAAYSALRVKEVLRNHVCRITFKKTDGTITERVGTLLQEYLPSFKGTNAKKRARISPKISFYSLTDNGWKSFLPANLISCKADLTELSLAA